MKKQRWHGSIGLPSNTVVLINNKNNKKQGCWNTLIKNMETAGVRGHQRSKRDYLLYVLVKGNIIVSQNEMQIISYIIINASIS